MNHTEKLRMKLATILSTDRFGLYEAIRLIQLRDIITDDRHFEFYHLISDKMREELIEILDDEDVEHGHILATASGYSAVLDWIDGDPGNLVTLLLDKSDTYAGIIASETLKLCFDIAEYSPDPSNSELEIQSSPTTEQNITPKGPRLASVVNSTEQNVPNAE